MTMLEEINNYELSNWKNYYKVCKEAFKWFLVMYVNFLINIAL